MENILNEENLDRIDKELINKELFMNSLPNDINIEKLFDKINKYVKENFIINVSLQGEVYYFRHNSIGYEIGMLYGPEIMYYLKRIDIEDESKFINIEDVRNNVVSLESEKTTNQMRIIKDAMSELNSLGISMDSVINETISISRELRRENGNYSSK